MSAIAKVMCEMGYLVSGSDLTEQGFIPQLKAQGVQVYHGHDAQYIEGADMVVYSSGIPQDNVELCCARERAIPLLHRSQILARLLNEKHGIAITGAHGKTTTSSMLTCIMTKAGLDPTFLIGGEVLDFGFNARAGKTEWIIAEADESDGSFLQYHPYAAIITNIEADHLENYDGQFERLIQAYIQFITQIKQNGLLVVCWDDPILKQILEKKDVQEAIQAKGIEVLRYGLNSNMVDISAKGITLGNRGSSSDIYHQGKHIGTLQLNVPGKHNLLNALACLCLGLKLGMSFDVMKLALSSFIGAKRRFQLLGEAQNIWIVDDYAHHPTEIIATIEAAKSTGRKVYAIFQPQRYTRTHFLFQSFSQAFFAADEVIMTDIYSPSGEIPIEGVSSKELALRIKQEGHQQVTYIPTIEEIVPYMIKQAQPGDLILTMGAGNIWKVAHQLVHYYESSLDSRKEA